VHTPGAIEAEVEEVLGWVRSVLPGQGRGLRVLEVGCGPGYLASKLLRAGVRLTAIDVSEEQVRAARERGVPAIASDFLSFEAAERFDALLFTRSLHHISPLASAIRKIRVLLEPGGPALADEFAHDEIDATTAAWFFDLQAALEESGVLAPDLPRQHGHRHHHRPEDRPPPDDPLERWRERHLHEPPLHGARAMVAALRAAFEVTVEERRTYLHRYLSDRLEDSDRGTRVFLRLRAVEQLRVDQGLLAPIGLRLVLGHRASPGPRATVRGGHQRSSGGRLRRKAPKRSRS
jgi:SAM-dependent methyltransferase